MSEQKTSEQIQQEYNAALQALTRATNMKLLADNEIKKIMEKIHSLAAQYDVQVAIEENTNEER